MPSRSLVWNGGLCVLVAAGCAPWSAPDREGIRLPRPQMSPDAVVLEIATIKAPPDSEAVFEELWQEVDEQNLPTELRRRLAANGFRCGLVGSQVPDSLRELLDRQEDTLGVRGEDGGSLQGLILHEQRLQSRAGRRSEIVATDAICASMSVLMTEDGRVSGRTFEQAQCVFGVRTFPQGDGRVRIQLTPEIQYGPMRQRYVGHEGVFRLDAERDREVLKQLRLEALLSPGQTLLITGTPDAKGLGRQFFTEDGQAGVDRKILLIRVAQTQLDDLFTPVRTLSPVATPSD